MIIDLKKYGDLDIAHRAFHPEFIIWLLYTRPAGKPCA
jgi:hypothetical protein